MVRLRILIALAIFTPALLFPQTASRKPKLVVAVVVDQFRYDYLTRYRKDYHGGFARMLEGGAVFSNAHYEQMPTVTAVGHSIFMSGAMPAVSGIAGNYWFDRETGRQVTSVCDSKVKLLGAQAQPPGPRCDDSDPASPRRLLVSTVGDELRNMDERSKVIGVSLKARSAILPSGHRANGAYWFDDSDGAFVSSNFYFNALPEWVDRFNARKLADTYVAHVWESFATWDFHSTVAGHPYAKLPASPWGNELIEAFAETAFENERLGQGASTDLLTVSFSSNDYVGHQVGPDAPEMRDMSIRTDRLLGKLMTAIEAKLGPGNVLYVLTADHGVSPTPAAQELKRMPGGYIQPNATQIAAEALNSRYSAKLAASDWISAQVDGGIYLNWKTVDGMKLSRSEAMRTVRDALVANPQLHAARVYSRDDLLAGAGQDMVGRAVVNGFSQTRSGDVIFVQEPYYLLGTTGTSHSTPWNYDTHVPVLFYGAGVKAATYTREIAPNDIAPTVAAILGIEAPSGSSGKVLPEIAGH